MSWSKCWLNYKYISECSNETPFRSIILPKGGEILKNAANELKLALEKLRSISISVVNEQASLVRKDKYIEFHLLTGETEEASALGKEGYRIENRGDSIRVAANTEQGILYGVFHIIREIQCNKSLKVSSCSENPQTYLRMLNHWDNIDGSIERGYAGNSLFFDDKDIVINKRTIDYARLCASIGINSVVINNVNVRGMATDLITNKYLKDLARLAQLFGGYGIKLFLSVNFAAPMEIGGLSSADPLDEEVINWWEGQVNLIYDAIPQFGGFLVKADSEFRPGPFTYNRTHAEGANLLAKALRPYNGLVIWRCFVYNCQQDWRDKKTDRAKAAYDNFLSLDGKFEDNVILQIKNGPMDFQVREPVSPLFGGLTKTNQILELQITQEYTGQQKHVCYLVPMWKEVLEFNTYVTKENGTVRDIISGKTFGQTNCGIAAVTNIGNDYNWTGHDLAAVNWYGYGRLCWNPALSAKDIALEWARQTFSLHNLENNKDVSLKEESILNILLDSWHTYEKYTSPLGIGWMVNPSHHYGPNVEGYEYAKWGTYHRADWRGVGVDRTSKGTGFTTQYHEPNFSNYEQKETCPEELLLFFHYVAYDYKLKSGKTLLQHIYDTHFEGVEEVEGMIKEWNSLKGSVEDEVFDRVQERLKIQYEDSKEWRDIINTYFYRRTGILDDKNRKIYE